MEILSANIIFICSSVLMGYLITFGYVLIREYK